MTRRAPAPELLVDVLVLVLVVLVLAAALGCGRAALGPYTLRTDADAPVSPEGLRPLEGTRLDEAWLAPELAPARIARLRVAQGSVVQLDPAASSIRVGGLDADRYRLSAADRDGIAEDLVRAFEDAIRESAVLSLAEGSARDGAEGGSEGSGGDALVLAAALDPIEMLAPMEVRGRDDAFASRTAALTLRVELREPGSGAVRARFVEERVAREVASARPGLAEADLYRVDGPRNRSTIRATLRRLAESLVDRLERIVEAPPVPTSPSA